jgi:hypothetical protein
MNDLREQQEQEMTEEQRRYKEQEERRQQRFEEERAEERRIFDSIVGMIAPLQVAEHKGRDDDPWWNYCSRDILTPDGERVGHIRLDHSGYSFNRKRFWKVTSPRIPTRGRYSYGEGDRRYKIPEKAAEAIKKFCIPVSADEERAKVLRRELKHYRDVVSNSYTRSLHVDGTGYTSPNVDRFIRLLASPIKQDQIEGAEYIRVLVRKKKVHNRWSEWVKATFIDPRQEELNTLDTSKEKIS